MAWSIFTDGGGPAAALRWAGDVLDGLGLEHTTNRLTFIYRWQVSEGGGGKYNPLNQGPVPGHPELTTTGEQYGGGAADFASWDAGVLGAIAYLHMPNYAPVLAALVADDLAAATAAIVASPWSEAHYHYAFSTAPLPNAPEDDVSPQDKQDIINGVIAALDHAEAIPGQTGLLGSLKHLASTLDNAVNLLNRIAAKIGA